MRPLPSRAAPARPVGASFGMESGTGILGVDLSIITVVIQKHYPYVARQIELFDALNPGGQYEFIVMDNTSTETTGLAIADPRCQVLPGAPRNDSLSEDYRGSYHHAAALNMAMKQVKSRFAVVIDPDLFVIYRNWIEECRAHMKAHDLAVFGVPWHYRWYRKYRYFPCVHFVMIDLEKVDKAGIDFTPALIQDHRREGSALHSWIRGKAPHLYNRSLIETRHDTGWRLQHDWGGRGRHRHALPVIHLDSELTKPKHLRTDEGRRMERRLPSRWSYLPRPEEYVEPSQAPGFRHPAFKYLTPEKFVWRGAPFAFHMRRNVRDVMHGGNDRDIEAVELENLFRDVVSRPVWTEWAVG